MKQTNKQKTNKGNKVEMKKIKMQKHFWKSIAC